MSSSTLPVIFLIAKTMVNEQIIDIYVPSW